MRIKIARKVKGLWERFGVCRVVLANKPYIFICFQGQRGMVTINCIEDSIDKARRNLANTFDIVDGMGKATEEANDILSANNGR